MPLSNNLPAPSATFKNKVPCTNFSSSQLPRTLRIGRVLHHGVNVYLGHDSDDGEGHPDSASDSSNAIYKCSGVDSAMPSESDAMRRTLCACLGTGALQCQCKSMILS